MDKITKHILNSETAISHGHYNYPTALISFSTFSAIYALIGPDTVLQLTAFLSSKHMNLCPYKINMNCKTFFT